MSLDITLTNKKTHQEVISMNWLRNPFGLCNWAEDNVQPKTKVDLWSVCNHWNYDDSKKVNRKLFKKVVTAYWSDIQKLERGFYAFDIAGYIQFIQPNLDQMPTEDKFNFGSRIVDAEYRGNKIYIPMEYFGNHSTFHLPDPSLDHMKTWFSQLVEFAELLQDKNNEFYCSN